MKNLRQRTKLYNKCSHVLCTILDEKAVITINGKIVDINGRKILCNGVVKRAAFSSDAQLNYLLNVQGKTKTVELWGREKDGFIFVHGSHKFTKKGWFLNIHRKYKRADGLAASELTKDNLFTGYHRSGDTRQLMAAIKLDSKKKE